MLRLVFLVVFALFQMPVSAAEPGYSVSQAYHRDTAADVSIDAVATRHFTPYEGPLRLGFESSAVWIELTPVPWTSPADVGDAKNPPILRVGPHSLDQIEVYEFVAGQWARQLGGDQHTNKANICPDDYHCFALSPMKAPTSPVYVRIQTMGLMVIETEILRSDALMTVVAQRTGKITFSLTIAIVLLVFGVTLLAIERSILLLVYSVFQLAVVLFVVANVGLLAHLLPGWSTDNVDKISTVIFFARVALTALIGWALLEAHQPSETYKKMIMVMICLCFINLGLIYSEHSLNATRLNFFLFFINPLVQIYGILSCVNLSSVRRGIYVFCYGVNLVLIVIGSLFVFSNMTIGGPVGFFHSGNDWRLNGVIIGLIVFLVVLSEQRLRNSARLAELQTLRSISEQARANEDKLSERRALVDMLTHELKNPLGTIRFALASLKRQITGDSDSLQRLQRIDASVNRMDDLIEHVARSNKIERTEIMAQPESIPALDIVHELIQEYPDVDRFKISIQDDSVFKADRQMLIVILENLLSNAHKYAAFDEKIIVTVTTEADTGTTCFEISNAVAEDQEPDESRLFERYYRHPGVQNQPGMGIGLSLVQSAAQKIGATVLYRKENQRVIFTVRIPN
ncbi:MAG: 7TM-DISM domain-containing protein [Polaromonas sp.]|nr:7TM-DISM domain-containing protein [Polaromonas sp.]